MFSVQQELKRMTNVFALPRRYLQPFVMAVLMITSISNPGLAANGGGYPDIPDIPDGPSASQMPDFGMPDVGMLDDMGGFDF
jgi:hypothetical protein